MNAINNLAHAPGTTHGDPARAGEIFLADAGNNRTWRILVDARPDSDSGPFLVIEKVDAAGNVVSNAPTLVLDLGSQLLQDFAAAAAPADKTITLRETKGCDDAGAPMYYLTLRSKGYSTALGGDLA